MKKTYQFADGKTLEVIHDDDPESPRSWDNLGTMALFANRHTLGDEKEGLKGHGIDHTEFGGWDEMEKWILHENPDCVILPVYMYSHSGITINTTGFQCPWDSGQIGFIFITRAKINEEYGEHGGRTDEQICEYLRNEVAVYDQFLTGDIYGCIFREECEENEDEGVEISSCWGFYGDDPSENGMGEDLPTVNSDELEHIVPSDWR